MINLDVIVTTFLFLSAGKTVIRHVQSAVPL